MKQRNRIGPHAKFLFWILLFVPRPAAADIGVPMVAVFLPPLWLSIFPIVALEAWIVARRHNRPIRSTLFRVSLANVLSTIVGIPFMWVVLALIEGAFAGTALGLNTLGAKIYAVTIQAPWLIPYEEDLRWMVPVALIVLAVPAYFLSVVVEWIVIRSLFSVDNRRAGMRTVFIANIASYALLAIIFWGVFAFSEYFRPLFILFQGVSEWMFGIVYVIARLLAGLRP